MMMLSRYLGAALPSLLLLMAVSASAQPVSLRLAENGRTEYVIAVDKQTAPEVTFAASELAAYLGRMTGAEFPIVRGDAARKAIVLNVGASRGVGHLDGEAYAITARGDTLYLTGGSGRAVLYAAYDLLARLGCQWLAPDLALYEGAAEVVPTTPTLVYEAEGDVIERPVFKYRKLYVEEGLSHDADNLARIVDWMPKVRFNVLVVPTDYQGTGRVRWDAWREALTPEMQRRGLIIEVGGHGYQVYMNADMEGGDLFRRHPEWFGRDENCEPSGDEHLVFNTEDPEAVDYVFDNVLDYVAERPEIDIFDFWPPDGARWAECAEWQAFGTPEDRQARLVNALQERVEAVRPDLRLEIIAYAHAKNPPQTVELDPEILVDFCPIGQNFEVQIYDTTAPNNAIYVDAIRRWREVFDGDISLYSYYRKYAWRSLPNVIPHYIQNDLQWYASVPLQGISTYAEPGDWYTYELNHYALAHLAWNPWIDVDALVDRFARARYGAASAAAVDAFRVLEDVVRTYGSTTYTTLKPVSAIKPARKRLDAALAGIEAHRSPATGTVAANLGRLALMLEYARRDLDIQAARAAGASEAEVRRRVEELVAFLENHEHEGVFLLHGRNILNRFLRKYE